MKTVVPVSFCIGAAMEMFMIQTGFYDIVTQKEGERMEERIGAEAAARERLKELKIDLPPPPKEL
jgi:hypothetical protein